MKRYLRELQAIHREAVKVLNNLLIGHPSEIVRSLCKRYYILQEYFFMRYQEARAYAISVLGQAGAASFGAALCLGDYLPNTFLI
jgi:hypothetical protein